MKTKSAYSLDVTMTGKRIKEIIRNSGYSVKELQLECPQPIYRWIKGIMLPSTDHLYMMSKIFNVHMDEMVVACNEMIH